MTSSLTKRRLTTLSLLLLATLPTACGPATGPVAQAPVAQRQSTAAPSRELIAPTAAQPAVVVSDPIIARIRDEGLNRSQVMQTLDYLTNIIGPRLTASPGERRATAWARDQFTAWGLENARLEPWGPFGRGWEVKRFSIQGVEPMQFPIIGYPRAWSPGLEAPIEAEVVHLVATKESDLEQYKGKLAGKIVMIGEVRKIEARFEPLATRRSDDELARLNTTDIPGDAAPDGSRLDTVAERRARLANADARAEALTRGAATRASATSPTSRPGGPRRAPFNTFNSRALAFVQAEGAAAVLMPSFSGEAGVMSVQGAAVPSDPGPTSATSRPRVYATETPPVPNQVAVTAEDFNRLARMLARGVTPKLALDLRVAFHDDHDGKSANVIAEIPGTDPLLKDQIVMVGAHVDSWHSATGTTDNAVGSAAAMEAVRILKALNLKPRRTIRVALWTGEEQGLYGSTAHVKDNYGEWVAPANGPAAGTTTTRPARVLQTKPAYEKLSAYFNLDNGTGRIRGIYAQGNRAAVPHFRAFLKDFKDLDASTVTLDNTGSTDHMPFDNIGLPGFQFIQDSIEYGTRSWHTNQDNYDRAQEADLKQASTIMAAFLWQTAQMDERFPRKPAQEPQSR